MQSFTRALFILLMSVLLMLGACSKSVEGETKKWSANTAKVTELAAQYPGFKGAIEARKTAAQTIFDASEGLDDDAKIKKMAEANSALMKGFVGELNSLDRTMDKLRKARVEAALAAGDQSSRLGAKVAAEDAQKALDRAEKMLKAGAADDASANAVLKKIKADLKTAQAAVDKVLAVDKAKKEDAKAKVKSDADAKAKAKADAEAKVADWKCAYCDTANKHDASSCKSCGAPREDKKPTKK